VPLQLQRREERGELLQQLALLQSLVDRLVLGAGRLIVLDLDHVVLQLGRELRCGRLSENDRATEGERQGGCSRDALHG